MEHSEPEPLASEINTRSGAKTAKSIWSLRSVAGKTSSTVWSQGSKESDRSKRFYSLLAEARNANEERRYVQGLGAFREAATLSRTDTELKTAAFDCALKEIKSLTAEHWRVAAAYLSEAAQLDPNRTIPDALNAAIQQAEREESIANTLAEIKPGGDAEQAYSRLTRALTRYPGDLLLEGHLPAVCASAVERRGPEERQRRMAVMTGLGADLERCTNVADVERIDRLSQSALGPYQADAEIRSVYEKIHSQAEAYRKASGALTDGQIASCLQVCSQVLHDADEQRYLVNVRQKAREFQFSGEAIAVEQANELLAKGPLAEALELTRHALTQFDGSTALLAIEAAISEKEATVRGLLEGGEASLVTGDFETAGIAFQQARRLLPLDPELSHHLATLLHSHARSQIDQDWRAFTSLLELEQSLQLERPLPADLAAVLQKRKQHAENARLQAEAIHKTAERGLQAEVLRDSGTMPAAKPPVQGKLKEAAAKASANPETAAIQAEVVRISRHRAARRLFDGVSLDKTTIGVLGGVAATLVCAALLAWHDHQSRAARPQRTLTLSSMAAGKAAPETPASPESAPPVEPNRSLATLEIRGAEPGTEVRVDNVLLGAAVSGSSLTRELSSGDHVVELSREGYTPRRMALHFAPGEVALLTGSHVQLQSTDAALLSAERREWDRASADAKSATFADFLQKYPQSSHAAEAKQRILDLEWQSVDKSQASALQAFLSEHPNNKYSAQAQDALDSLNRQMALQAEEADWRNLNRTNKSSLSAFLAKYPAGAHSAMANSLMANLDRRIETASADLPRREEHKLAVVAPASPDPTVLAERAAVLDVIGRFAEAWNAKDYRSIVEIEPDLNRRTLKAQLSPVKAVNMRISPVSPPQISGTEATVVCRRQADETFVDGSLKQNPESIVTYVLLKRNGAWGISAIR
jgi:hypothetical protein